MAVVYLLDTTGTTVIALDATASVNYGRTNAVTKSSVMSGASVADHYNLGNETVSFSGVISYNKIRDLAPTPRELEVLVNELIESYTRFSLYGNEIIPTLEDCVMTDFNVTQDNYMDAATVSISVEKVHVTDQAKKTSIFVPNPSSTTQGQMASEKDNGTGNTTQNTEEQSRTLLASQQDLADTIISITGGE